MALKTKLVDLDGPKLTPLARGRIEKLLAAAVRTFASVPDGELAVQVKRYERDGKRTKYSVSARIVGGGVRAKSESHSWVLQTALKEALEELRAQVKGSAERTRTLAEKRRRDAKRSLTKR